MTTPKLDLSWDEIGDLTEGLSFASRPFHAAVKDVTEEFDLGPRGAWMIELIGSESASYPLEIANLFRVGRSLISAELTRLSDAGLITGVVSPTDRRRTKLTLTPAGEAVSQRVKEELTRLVAERLGKYSREELLLCARMLRDFLGGPVHAEAVRTGA